MPIFRLVVFPMLPVLPSASGFTLFTEFSI